jgi:hypothetical protein
MLFEAVDLIAADGVELFGECDDGDLKPQVKAAASIQAKHRIQTLRASSESKLATELPEFLQTGESWHVISQGDIDSLSYISWIVNREPLDYLLFSTWCMSGEDVARIDSWVNEGRIGRLDCYVGEIFPSQYSDAYTMLCQTARKTTGRVAVFRNHAKVYAGANDRIQFAIETSANINTNPRCEQTAIHESPALFRHYKTFFDGIKSIVRNFDEWKPNAWPTSKTSRT